MASLTMCTFIDSIVANGDMMQSFESHAIMHFAISVTMLLKDHIKV